MRTAASRLGGGRMAMSGAAATMTAARVEPIEAIGYDGDMVEAQGFAYLALRSRQKPPISLSTTTGAPRPLTGGVFWPAGR
jgi:anhydro-N-acetylmuramic acid kinase